MEHLGKGRSGRVWFAYFRWCRPTEAFFDTRWTLPDMAADPLADSLAGCIKKTAGIIRVRLSELDLRSRSPRSRVRMDGRYRPRDRKRLFSSPVVRRMHGSSTSQFIEGAPVKKFMKANGIHPHLEIEELSVTLELDL